MNEKVILIISAVFPPEPVVSAKISFALATELSLSNIVEVVSPKPSRPYGFEFEKTHEKYSFKHIIVNSFLSPQSNWITRAIESLSFGIQSISYIIKNNRRIDKIYLNTWPLFSQFLIVRTAKKFGIPTILHVQDVYPEAYTNQLIRGKKLLNSFLIPIDAWILRNCSKVVTISDSMNEYLRVTRSINSSKMHVIRNWSSTYGAEKCNLDRLSTFSNEGYFTFMYCGNIGPVAGCDFLIDTFHNAKLKDARLVIAGSGSFKSKLIKRVEEDKILNVYFIDVPEGEVMNVQSRATILLLPLIPGASISSIPSKLPNYMFSSKAIIAVVDKNSDTAGVINESGCGWVIDPGDKIALSKLMELVMNLPIMEINEFGLRGLNYAKSNFSREVSLNYLIKIISNTHRA